MDTPPVTAVEPTDKEKEPYPTENKEQATEPTVTVTEPTTTDIYGWNDRTVAGILDNEVYLGTTVNCKSTVASYKDKRVIERPESEWLKFKNTHDAIIDETTWDIVRKVRAGKRRRTRRGEVNKHSGILHCADCGSKMYFIWGTTIKEDAFGFICSRYHMHMGEELCTPHKIREKALDEIVLEEIRRITYYARTKTNEFVEFINNKSSSENRRELSAKETALRRKEKRNSELQALFKRLYEDNVIGKVSNEEFRMLSEEYREEQKVIKEKIPQLQKEIDELKSITVSVEKFISIAKKYTDLQELTPEILRTFISKIVIHERAQKWKKTSEQQIDIYFQYIGSIPETPIEKAG